MIKISKEFLDSIKFIKRNHSVYILYDESKPIYVGITDDIDLRIKTHSKKIKFDFYSIFFTSKERKMAFIVENTLINFLSKNNFGDFKNKSGIKNKIEIFENPYKNNIIYGRE